MLRIHEMLVRIRSRIQIRGSITLTKMDPDPDLDPDPDPDADWDPAFFVSDLQDVNEKKIFKVFLLLTF